MNFLSNDSGEKETVVATSGLDGVLRLYDTNTQAKLLEYYVGCGPVWDVVKVQDLARCKFEEEALVQNHEVLVAGGDDGTVRVVFVPRAMGYLTPATMALVEHVTLRAGSKNRVVSVAAELSSDATVMWIWAGTQDGRLHRWDLVVGGAHSSGLTPKSISPSLVLDLPNRIIPWSLAIYNTPTITGQVLTTPPHSVVVGDAEGQVSIWDGAIGVLTQTMQHHKADILRVAMSPSKESIFTVGVDNTITLFQRSTNTTVLGATPIGSSSMDVDPHPHGNNSSSAASTAAGVAPWVFVGQRRSHTHDITSAVTGSTCLFTGGIDTKLMIHEYRDQLKVPGRAFLPFVQNPSLVATLAHGTPSQRDRMVVQLDSRLQIWKLGKPLKNAALNTDAKNSSTTGVGPKASQQAILEEQTLLLDITPKVNGRITCHAASSRAHRLAFSDHTHTKIFCIRERGASTSTVDTVSSVGERGLANGLANGSSKSKSSGAPLSASKSIETSSKLAKASGNAIANGLNGGADEESEMFLSAFSDPVLTVDKKMTLKGPSSRLAFTPSGVLVRATPQTHLIQLWDVSDADRPSLLHTFHEHTSAPRASLSSTKSASGHRSASGKEDLTLKPIHLLEVSPCGKFLATSDLHNRVFVFSLETMQLVYTLPTFEENVSSLAFDPEEAHLAVALTSNKFYIYHIESKSITEWSRTHSDDLPNRLTDIQERIIGMVFHPSVPGMLFAYGHSFIFYAQTAGSGHRMWKLIKAYQPLFVDFVDHESIAVIERPWLQVIQFLPPPFYRQRYGT